MSLAPSITSIILLFLFCLTIQIKCQEEVFVDIDEPTQTSASAQNEENRGFSGHIVALRPDYTFWRMMNVLKTMFDTRTAEKRRPSRELDDIRSQEIPSLRARRLLINFGRFRF